MAENAEVDGNGDAGDNKTVKRSPLSKKPNVPTEYSTSPRSGKKWVSFDSFGYDWGSQLEALLKWLQVKFAGTTN